MNPIESLQSEAQLRIERKSSNSGLALTPGDIEILGLIDDHRFLRREQLSALTGRPAKRLHRRLLKLERHRYLKTIRLPLQKYIYGLAIRGIEILIEQGRAEPERSNERVRIRELAELFLKHEMTIVDI